MASNQGQPETEPVVETADETQLNEQAPASENQPTTPTDETPRAERREVADVNDYLQELDAALSGAPEAEQGEPAADEAPEHPEGEQPTEEQPASEETTDEPTEAEPTVEETTPPVPKDFRPRLNSLDEQAKEAIALVKSLADKGEKISLAEAERRVQAKYGITPDAPEPTQPTAEEAPSRTTAQVDTEIAELKTQRKEAMRGLDPEKQIEIEDRIEALEKERGTLSQAEAKRAAEKQSAEDAAFDKAVAEDRAYAESVYPAMSDPKHAIHAEASRIWKTMEKLNNPLIYSETANSQVYMMAANKLGIAPVDPTEAPVVQKPVVAPVKKSSPSATPKPQPVAQSAVRRPSAVNPASAGDRTTTPGPTADPISKIGSVHDYDRLVQGL